MSVHYMNSKKGERVKMNPTKLQNVILFVVSNCDHSCGRVELAKIIYLIDVESMKFSDSTITGGEYRRRKKGPLAIGFGNQINQMNGYELKISEVSSNGKSGIPKLSHTLGDSPRFEITLDPMDLTIIQRVLTRIKGLDPMEIQNMAYGTEPMKAVLDEEEKLGHQLNGRSIDFSNVKKNKIYEAWKRNKSEPDSMSKEYRDFLARDRAEVDELINSWG